MLEHPIEGLMSTAMNSIKDMIDVNTIIGDPIETSSNTIIIPISKVSFGFASGGSEFKGETVDEYTRKEKEEEITYRLPFGGGSGAGASINPIAFLIIQPNNVKLMPINHTSAVDKLIDYLPEIFDKTNNMLNKYIDGDKNKKSVKKIETEEDNEEGKTVNKKTRIIEKIEQDEKKNINNDEIYEFEYNDIMEDE